VKASIAFLHPFFYRCGRGIERYVAALGTAMSRKGARVEILTWNAPSRVRWPEMEAPGAPQVTAFPAFRYFESLAAVPFYVAHFLRKRYTHTVIHFADYGEAHALRLLRMLGRDLPYSIVLHFPYSQAPHRYQSIAGTGLARNARHVIAVSRFVAGEAEPVLGRKCEVIPHGVDMRFFMPDLQARAKLRIELGIPDDAPVFLTAAALEERKGVQHLIRAMPQILRELPGAVYVVLGGGPYRETLVKLATAAGVAANVRFVEPVAMPARFYQAADLFVLLSKGEASPMSCFEAMACGLPLLASAHPPFGELIRPDFGMQVDADRPDAVAGAAVALLSRRENLKRMGEAALTHVREHHDWDKVATAYLALLAGKEWAA
jgi:glycosyltransferase involved in cell wall biosynthesis